MSRREPQQRHLTFEADKAWAAGFFEGEGTVGISRRWGDDTFRLMVQVSGVDGAPLRKLQAHWGGSLRQQKAQALKGRRDFWVWVLTFRGAIAFLRDIEPYLTSDRQKARVDVARDFQELKPEMAGCLFNPVEKERQRACFDRMKVLNQRGLHGIQPPGRPRLERTA